MASRLSVAAVIQFLQQNYDPEGAGVLKMALLDTTSSATSQAPLPSTVDGFTTLGECDATTYARQTLTGVDVAVVSGEIHCTVSQPSFANGGDATNDVRSLLVYIHVTDDTDSIPLSVLQLVTDETLDGTAYEPALDSSGVFKMTFASTVGEDAIVTFLEQTHDPEAAGKLKAALVMANSTVLTDTMPALMNGFTTLDECDDTGYSRQTITGMTASAVTADKLIKMVPTAPSFANNGDASRQVTAVVYYIHVTDDTDSIPLSVQQISATTLSGTTYSPSIPSTGIAKMKAT